MSIFLSGGGHWSIMFLFWSRVLVMNFFIELKFCHEVVAADPSRFTGVALAIFNFSRVYTWTWEDMPLENLNQSRIAAI